MAKKGMAGLLDNLLPPNAMQAVKMAAVGAASVYVTEQALAQLLPMVWKDQAGKAKTIEPLPRAGVSGVAGLIGGGIVAALGRKKEASLAWTLGPLTMASVSALSHLLTQKPKAPANGNGNGNGAGEQARVRGTRRALRDVGPGGRFNPQPSIVQPAAGFPAFNSASGF